MSRILVVEDEYAMRRALEDTLTAAGYRVLVASDGEEGLKRATGEKPDLVVLDIMLPKLDGFAVASALRRTGMGAPILMLTAKGTVDDRVQGLDAGADDYLIKPFSTDELLARARALLRRVRREGDRGAALDLQLGDVRVDFARQTATRRGDPLPLTSKEFAMLRLLVESDGGVVTRERFLDVVWGYGAFPTTRTVDNHIAGLRAKIEEDAARPRFLKTVHRQGYRLERPE
ncbi:MAG: response regulator transcription factor [Verrucomicrobiales bacterium]|nr:response regulator transcription factor [Verrucomicrobiales bacterium]